MPPTLPPILEVVHQATKSAASKVERRTTGMDFLKKCTKPTRARRIILGNGCNGAVFKSEVVQVGVEASGEEPPAFCGASVVATIALKVVFNFGLPSTVLRAG